MKTGRRRFSPGGLLCALLLAAELSFAADMLTTRAVSNMPAEILALIFAVSFLAFAILGQQKPPVVKWGLLLFTLALVICTLALYLIWHNMYKNGTYQDVDDDKSQVFAGKKVMAIVPHEDDEYNLLGGVLEQYVKYGSEVYIVYMTNGDYQTSGALRIYEAEQAMAMCGIPPENLIFLGYGDQLGKEGMPLYYCPDDEELVSHAGFSTTYGTTAHQPFSPGYTYTRRHVYEDIRTLLLRYTPDVVYCTDMDEHQDHQALAMFFERAMGEVLKARPDYEPQVFRGFAYGTAYEAAEDYYALNILSTLNLGEGSYISSGGSNVYNWAERLRLPVQPETLSRSLLGSRVWQVLNCYASQTATSRAESIASGDKVFWQRETGSICYEAQLWASSGEASFLNDFVLTDRSLEQEGNPGHSANTWIPSAEDKEKRVIIKFEEPVTLGRVVLYDNPSMEDNVLDVSIRLDSGAFVKSGPLEPNGSGTELVFSPTPVQELEISLMASEGSQAGLTEIELYPGEYSPPFSFIKLTDARGNFIYDYYMDESGQEELGLYAFGCSGSLEDYRIICIGDECYARLEEGRLMMHCPPGKSCLLTLMDESGALSDTVRITNTDLRPIKLAQELESYMRHEFRNGENSNTAILISKIKELVGKWQ